MSSEIKSIEIYDQKIYAVKRRIDLACKFLDYKMESKSDDTMIELYNLLCAVTDVPYLGEGKNFPKSHLIELQSPKAQRYSYLLAILEEAVTTLNEVQKGITQIKTLLGDDIKDIVSVDIDLWLENLGDLEMDLNTCLLMARRKWQRE